MNYEFPIIKNIKDVLEIVKGRKDFVVSKKQGYTAVNYYMITNDTFPPVKTEKDKILRECRGLIFDNETGDIISRRYHKFFNVNEREETLIENIDISKPHIILEKLDGSMITPIVIGGFVRWASKMGITDVAMLAEEFVAKNPHYKDFATKKMDLGFTPIFEFCSRRWTIVVDHQVERLVLTAIRNNETGEYVPYENMVADATCHNIDYVKALTGTAKNMETLVSEFRAETSVVRFENGHMLKIKNDTYIRLHKVKDSVRFEKDLVSVILHEELDDILPLMTPEWKSQAEEYRSILYSGINNIVRDVEYEYHRGRMMTRKEFALHSHESNIHPIVRGLVFKLLDIPDGEEFDTKELVLNAVLKHTNNNKKFSTIKELLPNCKWETI